MWFKAAESYSTDINCVFSSLKVHSVQIGSNVLPHFLKTPHILLTTSPPESLNLHLHIYFLYYITSFLFQKEQKYFRSPSSKRLLIFLKIIHLWWEFKFSFRRHLEKLCSLKWGVGVGMNTIKLHKVGVLETLYVIIFKQMWKVAE